MNARIRHWFHGLGSAVIGGAATSLTAAGGVAGAGALGIKVPNLTLDQIAAIALAGGFWTMVAYLKQSPLPPEDPENPTPSTKTETKPPTQ